MHLHPYNKTQHLSILRTWYSNPQILSDMELETMTDSQLEAWLDEPDRIHLVFFEEEMPVGCVNFYHYKTKFPSYEVGYITNPEVQGKGYATKMLKESLEYAKTELKIKKIEEVYVIDSNEGSKRVLEKNGFTLDRHNQEKGRYYYSKDLF